MQKLWRTENNPVWVQSKRHRNRTQIIQTIIKMCNEFQAKEVILYGSRAKGTARERSDIDIAVSGVASSDIFELEEALEDIPTLYTIDLVDLDTCKNQLLLEDIKQYGREIYKKI